MPNPPKIMFIRHAEKPDNPPPSGVNEDGKDHQHSLTVRGWQRAGALVPFFMEPRRPGIATPATIFGAGTSDDPAVDPDVSKSLRAQETVAPLAAKSGVPFVTNIPVGEEAQAIEAIKACDGVVLVAWEHKRIPRIAAGFLANPPTWGDRYDAVWVLDRQPDGSYGLSIVNQDVLPGDAPA